MLRTYDDWKSCAPEGAAFLCDGCGRMMGRPGTCSQECDKLVVEEQRASEAETERDIIDRFLRDA